jgi:hypothetical protein
VGLPIGAQRGELAGVRLIRRDRGIQPQDVQAGGGDQPGDRIQRGRVEVDRRGRRLVRAEIAAAGDRRQQRGRTDGAGAEQEGTPGDRQATSG